MPDLSSPLTILSAMITPAVLIMASGSLILTTSQRLGRIIDRTRKISDQFEELAKAQAEGEPVTERRTFLFELLGRATRRSRLLQRALTSLYLTLSAFVATSVSLGLVALFGLHFTWIPIAFGITGTGLLFYGSLLLIAESRIALASVDEEMDFVLRSRQLAAPQELLTKNNSKNGLFR